MRTVCRFRRCERRTRNTPPPSPSSGLGAQRREIDKNDLPQVHTEIQEFLRRLKAGESVADFQPSLGLIVEKGRIISSGECNLSGERYRDSGIRTTNYPMVQIGEICSLTNGLAFKSEDWQRSESGGLPIVRIQNLNTPESEFNYYTGEVSDRYIINDGELLFS